MYKLAKGRGAGANVVIQNTETMGSLILGGVTMTMLDVLKNNEGYSTSEEEAGKHIELRDEWSLPISEDTAKVLSKLAMKMKKPVRDQKKKSEQDEKPVKKLNKQPVDVFNMIFGIQD